MGAGGARVAREGGWGGGGGEEGGGEVGGGGAFERESVAAKGGLEVTGKFPHLVFFPEGGFELTGKFPNLMIFSPPSENERFDLAGCVVTQRGA